MVFINPSVFFHDMMGGSGLAQRNARMARAHELFGSAAAAAAAMTTVVAAGQVGRRDQLTARVVSVTNLTQGLGVWKTAVVMWCGARWYEAWLLG